MSWVLAVNLARQATCSIHELVMTHREREGGTEVGVSERGPGQSGASKCPRHLRQSSSLRRERHQLILFRRRPTLRARDHEPEEVSSRSGCLEGSEKGLLPNLHFVYPSQSLCRVPPSLLDTLETLSTPPTLQHAATRLSLSLSLSRAPRPVSPHDGAS